MNRSTTASLHSATPKRKNVPCNSLFRGGGFFLKWKGHFSFGVRKRILGASARPCVLFCERSETKEPQGVLLRYGDALQVFGQCVGTFSGRAI